MPQNRMLETVRQACLALPGTRESTTLGNPTFEAGRRTFAVVEEYAGHPSLAVKVGTEDQPSFLEDTAFYMTPSVGQHGWVSLKLDERCNTREIEILVRASYCLVATKKMLDVLVSEDEA